tara:strand:+ start:1719 stop:2003 length:285 start_codon:yes stop_codon:yes gene_type:complete
MEKTDKEVYDIAEHFKEEHNRLTNELSKAETKIRELKKIIIVNYALSRVIDEALTECDLSGVYHLQHLVDVMRLKNSQFLDNLVFEDGEESEDD